MNETLHQRAIQAARKGDWDCAHQIVQSEPDKLSARIHAWLHRREGDLSNAGYWDRQAGQSQPDVSLAVELDLLEASVNKRL